MKFQTHPGDFPFSSTAYTTWQSSIDSKIFLFTIKRKKKGKRKKIQRIAPRYVYRVSNSWFAMEFRCKRFAYVRARKIRKIRSREMQHSKARSLTRQRYFVFLFQPRVLKVHR